MSEKAKPPACPNCGGRLSICNYIGIDGECEDCSFSFNCNTLVIPFAHASAERDRLRNVNAELLEALEAAQATNGLPVNLGFEEESPKCNGCGTENCPFDFDGVCRAAICYSREDCGSRDENGEPIYCEDIHHAEDD